MLKTTLKTLTIAVSSALMLSACGTDNNQSNQVESSMTQQAVQIQGSFLYRERIALPPNAYATVALNNVTNSERPAETVVEQEINLNGKSVPIDYNLLASNFTLNPDMRYALQIEIRDANDTVLFATNPAQAVDATLNTQTLAPITLTQSSSKTSNSDSGLLGSIWRVEDINGEGIIDNSNISFEFSDQGLVGGMASCNNFNMPYEENNGILEIGAQGGAVTLKACAPALLEQERKFLELFSNITSYSFDETNALILKTDDDRTLKARID